jgi:hypothetical protein
MATGYGQDFTFWNRDYGAGAARGRRYGRDYRVGNPYGDAHRGYGTGREPGTRGGHGYSGGDNFGGSYGGGYGADHLTGRSGGAWRRYATDYSRKGRGYDAGLGRQLREGWRELARGARRMLPGYDRRW